MEPILFGGYFARPRYRGKTLVLPHSDMADFADSPWAGLPSEEWMGGVEGEGGAGGGKTVGTGIDMQNEKRLF